MPKLISNGTYHEILTAKTYLSHLIPARKLQKPSNWPPGGGQWWFQTYIGFTEIIISYILISYFLMCGYKCSAW